MCHLIHLIKSSTLSPNCDKHHMSYRYLCIFLPRSKNCPQTFSQILWRITNHVSSMSLTLDTKHWPEPWVSIYLCIWSFFTRAKWVMRWTTPSSAPGGGFPDPLSCSIVHRWPSCCSCPFLAVCGHQANWCASQATASLPLSAEPRELPVGPRVRAERGIHCRAGGPRAAGPLFM